MPNKLPQPPERRRSQQRSRRSDDHLLPDFRDLVEGATFGILIHRHFKPLYANQACATILGYKQALQIADMPLLRPLFEADHWPQLEADYDALVHGKAAPRTFRQRVIRKDGQAIWLSVTERLIDWQGKPAVQWSVLEITAQMQLEQNLLESEQRLRSLLEILPTPVYIARRRDGQILFVNRKFCLLLQQSTAPLLKSRSDDFFVDTAQLADLRKSLTLAGEMRDVEMKMRAANGRAFIGELAVITLEYADEAAVLVAVNDISQRKQLEAELFHQASTDPMTGICNRRYFLTQAEADLRRSRRYARDMALLLCDIDHFKNINDKFGHAAGDVVIQAMVAAAQEGLRTSDIMGRLGGEEFAILLPETNLADATEVAERLRERVAAAQILQGEQSIACTVSIGVAQLNAHDADIGGLLHRADLAMYQAKAKGRNRVEIAA